MASAIAVGTAFAEPAALLPAAAIAVAACWFIGKRMIARCVLPDRPTERSSHVVATPRSGGIAIFGGWLLAMTTAAFVATFTSGATPRQEAAFVALVAMAFVLGLADDRGGVGPSAKLFAQVAAAVLFVASVGPFDLVFLLGGAGPVGLAWIVSVLWIVGVMNAVNFMDGVDGIAASCGALVLAALALVAAASGALFWAVAAALFAIALAAFLPLNFPGGKIFLGDSGSQTAGFVIAAVALGATNEADATIALAAPIAMTAFLSDVAFTLAHRIVRRRPLMQAHREHAYQLLVRMGWPHARATALYAASTSACCGAAAIAPALAPPAQGALLAALVGLHLSAAGFVFAAARRRGMFGSAGQDARATEVSTSDASASR